MSKVRISTVPITIALLSAGFSQGHRSLHLHLVRTLCGLKPRCDQQNARLASAKVDFRETLCCEIA